MAKYKGKTEKQVQSECMRYLETLERQGICYAVRTQSASVKLDSGRFMRTGRAGCPDCTACIKGQYIAIEFKREKGGKLSESQKQTAENIEKAGGKYLLISSLQEMIDDLKSII